MFPLQKLLPIDQVKRRATARRYFFQGSWDVETCRAYYQGWRDDTEFMRGEAWKINRLQASGGLWGIKRERVAWRLPKRGDWLYKENLRKKLKWIDELPYNCDFDPTDVNGVHETHFLFVTWTTKLPKAWDNKINRYEKWREDSEVCNRTMQRLRNHYGEVQYLRSNEGTLKGYPAPHGILFFPDKTWHIEYRESRDPKNRRPKWRLIDKEWREFKNILEGKDIRAKPVMGFTDIQGIFSPRASLKHITKYCYGGPEDFPQGKRARKMEIQDITYFWLWITGKHTYSMSRKFVIKIQVYLKVKSELDTAHLANPKDATPPAAAFVRIWVNLKVDGPEEAERWVAEEFEKELTVQASTWMGAWRNGMLDLIRKGKVAGKTKT